MSNILSWLIVSTLFLIGLPAWLHFEDQGIQNMKTAVAASQMKVFTDAAQGYIQTYYTALEGSATATAPATITPAMLQSTGFLPASFAAANPWTQGYMVQVLQPSPGTLQALVLTTGGGAIPQAEAPAVAAQSGAEGGFIPYPNQYGTLTNTVAEGSYGGWQVSMQYYTNPGQGHLAALIALDNGQIQTDYLYRSAVPGEPQLNQMQTNLDMGNNNLNNAATVNANGNITGGGTISGSTVQAGKFTYPGTAVEGAGCTTTGAVAANSNGSGTLLTCQGGSWQAPTAAPNPGFNSGIPGSFSSPQTYVNNPGVGDCLYGVQPGGTSYTNIVWASGWYTYNCGIHTCAVHWTGWWSAPNNSGTGGVPCGGGVIWG